MVVLFTVEIPPKSLRRMKRLFEVIRAAPRTAVYSVHLFRTVRGDRSLADVSASVSVFTFVFAVTVPYRTALTGTTYRDVPTSS